MNGVNKVILMGRVGKDPQANYTANGLAVVNLSLATSESWKDKDGQKAERTEWHNVVFFGKLAEIVTQYVGKGALIYTEGKITNQKYTDKATGEIKYATKIVGDELRIIESNKDKQPLREKTATKQDDFNDDIPF